MPRIVASFLLVVLASCSESDSQGSPCASGLAVCGSSCVDLSTDPINCGACNHSCGIGTCTASQCTIDGDPPTLAISYQIQPKMCTLGGASASVSGLVIFIALDRFPTSACDQAIAACVQYADLYSVALTVNNVNTSWTASLVGPGTYTVGSKPAAISGSYAMADAQVTDSICENALTGSANPSGTIVITYVNYPNRVSGSYDIIVYGVHYTGSFNTVFCGSANFHGDLCSGELRESCPGTTRCVQ